MPRDIDQIIERLRTELPGVEITQFHVTHPGADDDGVWFIKIPGRDGEVQIESSHGSCPFFIESDLSDDRIYGRSIDEVVQKVRGLYARDMTDRKSVLIIGLDPTLIDFSKPGYPPGMTAEKVFAGIKSCEDELAALGYKAQTCMHDFGETAEAVVLEHLKQRQWDCVMIGAGVRANPSNFILFEKLINVVHKHAPQARICFNTLPSDTTAAVKRWL